MTRRPSEREIAAAEWWRDLKATTNETFLPLYFERRRYLVLMGGAGSGKSIFAGRKILERAVSEPGHRFLVVRKVGKTLRESCFAQLQAQLAECYAGTRYKVNKTDMSITFANGSVILFSGLDDVEKLKSIYEIDGIWVEEASELLESDFNQLDIRLRAKSRYYLQIVLTFNPISILHWLKKRFFDKPNADMCTHRSTYKDNRFLTDAAKQVLEAFREVDPYYYQVYCLGEWGITGQSVFNAEAVARRLASLGEPLAVGDMEYDYDGQRITNPRFVERADGVLRIYKKPREGVPYVIGGDTAGYGSDASVAQVLDNTTGEQVAVLRAQAIDEDVFTRVVYALGAWYNNALIAVETNFSTYPVLELERLRYPRQYIRRSEDAYTHKITDRHGFATTKLTRPIILSELIGATHGEEGLGWIHDRVTLEEMATFVRGEDWKPQAENGAHDDCVMALAIAVHARAQQTSVTQGKARPKWSEEQWEDWRDATDAERARLIDEWGTPR